MASQITNLTIIYSTVYSGADQRKRQSLFQIYLLICKRFQNWIFRVGPARFDGTSEDTKVICPPKPWILSYYSTVYMNFKLVNILFVTIFFTLTFPMLSQIMWSFLPADGGIEETTCLNWCSRSDYIVHLCPWKGFHQLGKVGMMKPKLQSPQCIAA